MGERRWIESYAGVTDAEVLREILLNENGEPRDGVEQVIVDYDGAGGGAYLSGIPGAYPVELRDTGEYFVIAAEMLEADDE